MGREQRRKELKKNRNIEKIVEDIDTGIKWTTIVKVMCAVILILLVIYYVLAVFVTKELDVSGKNDDTSTTEDSSNTSSVSNKILATNIFNQKEEVYYVYLYDFSDEDDSVSSAINNKSDIKIYRVDTSSSLNSKYVDEDNSNTSAKNLDELRVKSPTLLEVTNDHITGYYEGSSSITDFLSK